MAVARIPGSFRDPAGCVVRYEGHLYRVVRLAGARDYRAARESGFLDAAMDEGLLVRHEELPPDALPLEGEAVAALLRPEAVPFVSYPYEWCVSQLREAALLTLRLQQRALDFDLSLRDASAFNVQFRGSAPVFIDTLSFEPYAEGRPWVAYRQFCEHFLAPLALAGARGPEALRWLRVHLDGVPLALASAWLPWRTRLRLGQLLHLHLHARSQRRHADRGRAAVRRGGREGGATGASGARVARLSRRAQRNLLESLASTVGGLAWEPPPGAWTAYEREHTYAPAAFSAKESCVRRWLGATRPRFVLDLGANTGAFSRLAREAGARAVALDSDPGTVEVLYRRAREAGDEGLLPLVMDLANPSPALGWAGREREGLFDRGAADAVLALALVHHLAIAHNVSLPDVFDVLARLGRHVLVEFVPKSDPQVQRMLATREDVFEGYHFEGFEAALVPRFACVERIPLPESDRVLYALVRREGR